MIIYDPASKLRGHQSNEVVEFVDIFPTICDMMGIRQLDQFEGKSLYPLLNNPKAKSKGYAVARWLQGYTLVTDDKYFYTEWWDKKDNITERLLFDHNTDPEENYNVADRPQYGEKVSELSLLLKQRRGMDFDKY
jgi:arylsulfatase A-like enzyme